MSACSDSLGLHALAGDLLQELDFHPDLQLVELGIGQVVPLKVEFGSVGCLDESMSIVELFGDAAMQGCFMHLYIAPLFTDEVPQLSQRGVEGVANDDVDVFMTVDAIDDDLGSGDGQVDVNLMHASLSMVLAGGADRHFAVHDVIAEFIELFGALADFRFDSIGVWNIDKAYT